jgi:CRP-like cAMP-binding protein
MRKVLYIFGLLTDADVDWIAHTGKRSRFRDGDVLIEQGKHVEAIILLLQGALSVTIKGAGEVARLGVGEIVGEMSYVDSAPPSATVKALGDCLALVINKRELTRKLQADVAFGCRFYRALAVLLADRLRGTERRLSYASSADLENEAVLQDELDMGILDNVSMAGHRFDRILKTLTGVT